LNHPFPAQAAVAEACHADQAALAARAGDHAGEMLAHYNRGRACEALDRGDDAVAAYRAAADRAGHENEPTRLRPRVHSRGGDPCLFAVSHAPAERRRSVRTSAETTSIRPRSRGSKLRRTGPRDRSFPAQVAKLSRESDSVRGTVGALAALAALHLRRGDDAAAAAALKEKLGLLRRLLVASPARAPLRAAIVASLAALGETYRRRGLAGEHHACCAKRLDESGRLGDADALGDALEALARARLALRAGMLRPDPRSRAAAGLAAAAAAADLDDARVLSDSDVSSEGDEGEKPSGRYSPLYDSESSCSDCGEDTLPWANH